jgi:hypothetical protein
MLTNIDSILQNLTNVNPPPEPNESAHLSRPDARAYQHLDYKYLYWTSRKKLRSDGSFFLVNSEFAKGINTTPRAICKIKKRLRARGLIRYTVTKGYRGATYYWLPAYDKKEVLKTPEPVQERPPLDPETVRQMAKLKGKDFVLNCEAFKGYSRAEIEGCFED